MLASSARGSRSCRSCTGGDTDRLACEETDKGIVREKKKGRLPKEKKEPRSNLGRAIMELGMKIRAPFEVAYEITQGFQDIKDYAEDNVMLPRSDSVGSIVPNIQKHDTAKAAELIRVAGLLAQNVTVKAQPMVETAGSMISSIPESMQSTEAVDLTAPVKNERTTSASTGVATGSLHPREDAAIEVRKNSDYVDFVDAGRQVVRTSALGAELAASSFEGLVKEADDYLKNKNELDGERKDCKKKPPEAKRVATGVSPRDKQTYSVGKALIDDLRWKDPSLFNPRVQPLQKENADSKGEVDAKKRKLRKKLAKSKDEIDAKRKKANSTLHGSTDALAVFEDNVSSKSQSLSYGGESSAKSKRRFSGEAMEDHSEASLVAKLEPTVLIEDSCSRPQQDPDEGVFFGGYEDVHEFLLEADRRFEETRVAEDSFGDDSSDIEDNVRSVRPPLPKRMKLLWKRFVPPLPKRHVRIEYVEC